MYMYMCMYVRIYYIYIYVYVYIYIYKSVHACMCVHVFMHTPSLIFTAKKYHHTLSLTYNFTQNYKHSVHMP